MSGLGRLAVSEGPHVIKVSGPVNETHNIALESGYFERWFSKPVWILNLGGEAVLRRHHPRVLRERHSEPAPAGGRRDIFSPAAYRLHLHGRAQPASGQEQE